MPILGFDQTPVRLKLWSDGAQYISTQEVEAAARNQSARNKRRLHPEETPEVQKQLLADARANPDGTRDTRELVACGGDKHRYTLVTFQAVHHWLDPEQQPEGCMPEPVLIVYSDRHARLEDIDQQGQWNKTVRPFFFLFC